MLYQVNLHTGFSIWCYNLILGPQTTILRTVALLTAIKFDSCLTCYPMFLYFMKSCCISSVLRHLFPSEKPRIYDLRPQAHNFILPLKDDSNFIPRVLFRF